MASAAAGDRRAADALLPSLYDELRKLARARLAQERPGQHRRPAASRARARRGGQRPALWAPAGGCGWAGDPESAAGGPGASAGVARAGGEGFRAGAWAVGARARAPLTRARAAVPGGPARMTCAPAARSDSSRGAGRPMEGRGGARPAGAVATIRPRDARRREGPPCAPSREP
ncbi:MAG: ECF-type sigma factor [Planctomycetota bacterium]|nr:ECF-type sigma factor [Planctomycetota bacterium]